MLDISRASRVAGPIVFVSLLGACAEFNQQLADAQKMLAAGNTSGAPGSPGTPSTSGAPAATPASGSGGDSQVWCCVNKAFYDCKTGENALKCIGQPFQLMPCTQKCAAGDSACTMTCLKDYGPDAERGHCERTPARDGECK